VRVGRTFVYLITRFAVSCITSFTSTDVGAHSILTSGIDVTVIGVGSTLVQVCKTGKVVAVITRHIIPSVTMLGTKSVDAVFVSPVVWLPRSPESKTAYFFVGPNERPFNTPVV